jgi:hypothetical protein
LRPILTAFLPEIRCIAKIAARQTMFFGAGIMVFAGCELRIFTTEDTREAEGGANFEISLIVG